jgi:hypothetical protein
LTTLFIISPSRRSPGPVCTATRLWLLQPLLADERLTANWATRRTRVSYPDWTFEATSEFLAGRGKFCPCVRTASQVSTLPSRSTAVLAPPQVNRSDSHSRFARRIPPAVCRDVIAPVSLLRMRRLRRLIWRSGSRIVPPIHRHATTMLSAHLAHCR